MRPIPHPRRFFETMVKPAYEDWQSDPQTEWKAKAAVANADILAERLVEYWKALKPDTDCRQRDSLQIQKLL
jgi:hypothetical protein